MPPLLLVMTGGAIGAGARYLTGRAFAFVGSGWPWGTLAVNLAGGFAMGLLTGLLVRGSGIGGGIGGEPVRLFVGVGILGGFTTFSAFSLEVALMIERGALVSAAGYVAASVVGATTALFAGLALTRVTA